MQHMNAWINLLRQRYTAHPQKFRSERLCFLDCTFSMQWRFNYKDFAASLPDANGLGRRLPGGAWNYYAGTVPSFCRSNKVWGKDIDEIYAPVNYRDCHWFALWISIPKRHIVVFDSIKGTIEKEVLDQIMEPFLFMIPYMMVELTTTDEERTKYSLEPYTYSKPEDIPQARSGDCGVYALKYIECHALGLEFSKTDFAASKAKTMRDKMAVDIRDEIPDAHLWENRDNDDNLDPYS